MTVNELITELKNYDSEQEVFLFFKTLDGRTNFTSDLNIVSDGTIVNEYGSFEKGVLLMKE